MKSYFSHEFIFISKDLLILICKSYADLEKAKQNLLACEENVARMDVSKAQ